MTVFLLLDVWPTAVHHMAYRVRRRSSLDEPRRRISDEPASPHVYAVETIATRRRGALAQTSSDVRNDEQRLGECDRQLRDR